jgi:pimeloyl-ACP methyl ester carboxylesterase
MINEREFISNVETASPEAFANILRNADAGQQRALCAYFGRGKFERLRTLAQRQVVLRDGAPRLNVVILPGILGSELCLGKEKIWFGLWSIIKGDFDQLQVNQEGASVKPLSANGLMRKYYGELEQYLLAKWNVTVFPFDWRLGLRESADLLNLFVKQQFGENAKFNLVAHSMGGLVSRSFARKYPSTWALVENLIMLGTPNYGSLAIPQLYTGLYRLMRTVAALDQQHDLQALLQFAKMFVGTYQMLPIPGRLVNTMQPELLFDPATYGSLQPPSDRFTDAQKFQSELDEILDPQKLTYIAGTNQPTANGIRDWQQLHTWDGYSMTALGDGTVPHTLGLLNKVTTYYVEEEHSLLPANRAVIDAVQNIMAGTQVKLQTIAAPMTRAVTNEADLRAKKQRQDEYAVSEINLLKGKMLAMRGAYESTTVVSPEEQQITDLVFTGKTEALAFGAVAGPASSTTMPPPGIDPGPWQTQEPTDPVSDAAQPELNLHIQCCRIEEVGEKVQIESATQDVDSISVGHYIGVLPIAAEGALDAALSIGLPFWDAALAEGPSDNLTGLVTQFTQRGIIRGELGRPFFIPDTRKPSRTVVIAGMGSIGRFGSSELTLLGREILWALGRLGKKHLATVLIGAGAKNLEPSVAVAAWLRGAALTIANHPDEPRITDLTIVELDAEKAEVIRKAALACTKAIADMGLTVNVFPKNEIPETAKPSLELTAYDTRTANCHSATRILVEQQDDFYRFSAVSETASFPERAVRVNPAIVASINDSLAAELDPAKKKEWGEPLFKLLVPQDVQSLMSTSTPIVLACDSNVAQLHWELMVNPDAPETVLDDSLAFIGLNPGVTRQLRNNFGGPPEPPPPSSRVLRILIIADTDFRAPLPGAAEEGVAVKELFQHFQAMLAQRKSKLKIEVEALIGPQNATAAQVMKRLLRYPPYDVLHYSGHCMYDKADPPNSGWIFSDDLKLTAREMSRVDRIPSFVFSNACQSGVTPSRPDLRSPEMAASFAESFFERGVKNFVCTAWPVADDAAAIFAKELYRNLLGIGGGEPAFMNEAMRKSRLAIFKHPTGSQSWGAYQHYGNPWLKLV